MEEGSSGNGGVKRGGWMRGAGVERMAVMMMAKVAIQRERERVLWRQTAGRCKRLEREERGGARDRGDTDDCERNEVGGWMMMVIKLWALGVIRFKLSRLECVNN